MSEQPKAPQCLLPLVLGMLPFAASFVFERLSRWQLFWQLNVPSFSFGDEPDGTLELMAGCGHLMITNMESAPQDFALWVQRTACRELERRERMLAE